MSQRLFLAALSVESPDVSLLRSLCNSFVLFMHNHVTRHTGDYTLVFIIILLLLVAAVTLMQKFESPALVSSFKGLLTLMGFIQSFVSLKVRYSQCFGLNCG